MAELEQTASKKKLKRRKHSNSNSNSTSLVDTHLNALEANSNKQEMLR